VIQPINTEVVYVSQTADMLIARVTRFDLNVTSQGAFVPTQGYSVGSVMVGPSTGTSAVLTYRVSNDPDCDVVATHPDAATLLGSATLSPVSTEGIGVAGAGLPLEHAYFGVELTTAHGSAAFADLYIVLRK
jgi:hypothetical protein